MEYQIANKSVEDKVVDALIDKGWHISFAESCTAGMAVATLVNAENASKVLSASVVTYANEAKIKYANVSQDNLDQYGAVSQQVALQMAQGVAKNNNAQVGVGISGIAGPGGGTPEKPVGTVCFGFVIGDKEFATTQHFGDLGRQGVRQASVNYAFNTLLDELSK